MNAMHLTYSGRIPLSHGFTFVWLRDSNEIYGCVERPNGAILSKSGGWFRTTNPADAAYHAQLLVDEYLDRANSLTASLALIDLEVA